MARPSRSREFARTLSEALGLPRTAARIISTLVRARDALDVDEIVRRVQSSERSVRENLRVLLQRGILIRRAFVTANKKLAYAYSLRPLEDLLGAARRDVARTIARIEAVARHLRHVTT